MSSFITINNTDINMEHITVIHKNEIERTFTLYHHSGNPRKSTVTFDNEKQYKLGCDILWEYYYHRGSQRQTVFVKTD